MTDEKFDSRISPTGVTEFVYGISWKNTSQESLGELPEYERQTKRGQKYQEPERKQKFLLQADKQTKLELEDKAAAGLKKRLAKEKLCPKGYDISNVAWKADNIRLLGFCY